MKLHGPNILLRHETLTEGVDPQGTRTARGPTFFQTGKLTLLSAMGALRSVKINRDSQDLAT